MKINSKIKYAGVAAAALLAVAPIAAPAITAGTQAPTTVQAATVDNTKINGTYAISTIDNQATNNYNVVIANNTVTGFNNGNEAAKFDANATIQLNTRISLYNNSADTPWVSNEANYTRPVNTPFYANAVTVDKTGAIVSASDGTYTVAMSGLNAGTVSYTEDTNIASNKALLNAKTAAGATIYTDNTTTDATTDKLANDANTPILAYVYGPDGKTIVAYKIGEGQYVKETDATATALTLNTYVEKGSVQTTKSTPVYKSAVTLATYDVYVAKGQTVDYTKVARTTDGEDYSYYSADLGGWVSAKDVEAADTNTDSDLAISNVPANSLNVDSAKKAVVVYNDAATTKKSGSTLSTDYTLWAVTRVAKDADGKTVAYDLGENQWVKASDVTLEDDTDTNEDVKVSNTVSGDALYSNYKAATIYSDPAATKAVRTLSTSYNEWSAFKVSKDNNGKIIAYDLGGGQWVKASDLVRQVNLSGTFYTTAGTPLTNAQGEKTGTIASTGSYQIFAVRYIDGKQSLKLGNDSQWIVAANGDYYPA